MSHAESMASRSDQSSGGEHPLVQPRAPGHQHRGAGRTLAAVWTCPWGVGSRDLLGGRACCTGSAFPLRCRGRAQWVGRRTRGKPRTGLGGFGEGEKPAQWVSLSGPKEPEIMFAWGRLADGRGPSLRCLAEAIAPADLPQKGQKAGRKQVCRSCLGAVSRFLRAVLRLHLLWSEFAVFLSMMSEAGQIVG